MLRKLEKGLSNAKLKSQSVEAAASYALADPRLPSGNDSRLRLSQYSSQDGIHSSFRSGHLFLHSGHFDRSPDPTYHGPVSASRSIDQDDDEGEQNEDGMYPVRLIRKESQRNSFFGTVLGPSDGVKSPSGVDGLGSTQPSSSEPSTPYTTRDSDPQPLYSGPLPVNELDDPIVKGIMTESEASTLMDMVHIRLNPFINLFEAELHTASYVRRRSPFLFTTLMMAGCKFFKPSLYVKCRELAYGHAVRVFAEGRKSTEIVQAFMCLTYWKEPEDHRTWSYIGYACRMAVELGLNRYTARSPENETALQRLERRNRERTYLVLFVHDRSLSTQTGRLWMLPEDDIVTESQTWHEQIPSGTPIRPEDVIVAAFVTLRCIASETTKMFSLQRKNAVNSGQPDTNFEFLLNACNAKLSSWSMLWEQAMKKANGDRFHISFLRFFRLYCTVFLNSFGIQGYVSNSPRWNSSIQALSTCYQSAVECLEIVVQDFAPVQMLKYSQESIATMTAYCVVMLLRLIRNSAKSQNGHLQASAPVFSLIISVADAYEGASLNMPSSSACAHHSRFLRSLVEKEEMRFRQVAEKERFSNPAIDPTLQNGNSANGRQASPNGYSQYSDTPTITNGDVSSAGGTPNGVVDGGPLHVPQQSPYAFGGYPPAHSQTTAATNGISSYNGNMPTTQQTDMTYYATMCRELGVSQGGDIVHDEAYVYGSVAPPYGIEH